MPTEPSKKDQSNTAKLSRSQYENQENISMFFADILPDIQVRHAAPSKKNLGKPSMENQGKSKDTAAPSAVSSKLVPHQSVVPPALKVCWINANNTFY